MIRPTALIVARSCAQVVGALATVGEMLLESPQISRIEGALEVVGDELDELLAADRICDGHSFSGAR